MFNSGRTSLWRKPTSTTRASRTGLSIVCFQFLQLALMLIARKGHGRPFSQLEAVTLGFAICDSVDYLLFMYKQQRVERGLALDTPGTKYDINFAHKTYDRFWDVLKNDTVNDHSTTVPQSRHDSPALPTNMVTVSDNGSHGQDKWSTSNTAAAKDNERQRSKVEQRICPPRTVALGSCICPLWTTTRNSLGL